MIDVISDSEPDEEVDSLVCEAETMINTVRFATVIYSPHELLGIVGARCSPAFQACMNIDITASGQWCQQEIHQYRPPEWCNKQ